jgi:large subunit ribosomal protein L25
MELAANKREIGGGKEVRKAGFIPAIVYNKELNIPISVEFRAFDKVFRSQGTSSIIDLKIEGDVPHEVLVKAVQMDKRLRVPQHVDFYAVTAGQLLEVHIPIEFIGNAAGIKEGGLLDVQKRDVLISILPRLIPHDIKVDVTALEIGDSLHLRDVIGLLPPEAEVLDDIDATLIAIVPPRVEAEADELSAASEPEVIAKGKDEDDEDDDA